MTLSSNCTTYSSCICIAFYHLCKEVCHIQGECVPPHVYRGHRRILDVLLYLSSTHFLRTMSLTKPSAILTVSKLQQSTCQPSKLPQCWGYRHVQTQPVFHTDPDNLNSHSQDYTASTFTHRTISPGSTLHPLIHISSFPPFPWKQLGNRCS